MPPMQFTLFRLLSLETVLTENYEPANAVAILVTTYTVTKDSTLESDHS